MKQAVKTIGRGSLTEMEKPDVWQRLMDEQMRLFGFGLSEYVREKDELMLKVMAEGIETDDLSLGFKKTMVDEWMEQLMAK